MKNVVILGSTGSIGVNTLKVIERFPKDFKVIGLTAYNSIELLEEQIKKFRPKYVAVTEKGFAAIKSKWAAPGFKILDIETDLGFLVSLKEVDIVVIAMRGSAALLPFLSAVRSGKRVAPANKEALVIAGDILMREAKKSGAEIIPIDSEQSAIFQCLEGQNRRELKKIYLTASGGALLNVPKSKFNSISIKQILNHPRWKMGKKITVDSATLMNKGFEIIEALRLFDLSMDQIKVVVHPQAVIHSMVEFVDGSILAQMGVPDMRLPIQYALTYPRRLSSNLESVSFAQLKELTFMEPDYKKFPSLALAMTAAKKGGTYPAVLNASDEEAVEAFLEGRITFLKIYSIVERVFSKHQSVKNPTLADIKEADIWAREQARKIIYN